MTETDAAERGRSHHRDRLTDAGTATSKTTTFKRESIQILRGLLAQALKSRLSRLGIVTVPQAFALTRDTEQSLLWPPCYTMTGGPRGLTFT